MGDTLSSSRRLRAVRTAVLAGALTIGTLGFGGVASAQDDPSTTTTTTTTEVTTTTTTGETSSSEGEPAAPATTSPEDSWVPIPIYLAPTVTTASGCAEGTGSVEVTIENPNDVELTYVVHLGDDLTRTVAVAANGTETATFEDVAAGDYPVRLRYEKGGASAGRSSASVDRCSEITEPVDDALQVFVRCEDGVGLVTIRVFNTEGESRTYTVSVDDLTLPGEIELGADEYAVVVDEAPAPDGRFTIRVVAEGIDRTETADVACAPAPSTPATTTGTTTPAPQPRPAPAANSGGLAGTGAAVGGIAALALLALALGGGLVIAARRRRPSTGD